MADPKSPDQEQYFKVLTDLKTDSNSAIDINLNNLIGAKPVRIYPSEKFVNITGMGP
jgi:hypothetical protein